MNRRGFIKRMASAVVGVGMLGEALSLQPTVQVARHTALAELPRSHFKSTIVTKSQFGELLRPGLEELFHEHYKDLDNHYKPLFVELT